MSSTTWTIEKKLCRCCHSEGEFKNLAELCFDAGSEESYVDMIKHCFFINIIPIPGLLSIATFTICESCITHVKDAVQFRKQVEACEDKFLNFYSRNAIKVERPIVATIEIKEEELDSCNDDDFSAADDRRDNFHELSDCGLEKLADKSDSDGLEELEFEEIVQEKPTKAQSKTTKAANKEKKKTGRPKKTKGDQEESQSREDSEKITDKSDGLEELKFEKNVQEKSIKAQSKTTKAANKEKKKIGRPKKTKVDQEESQSQEDSEKINYPQIDDYVTEARDTAKKFTCKACDITYKRVSDLRYHINRKHLKKKFIKCKLCSESFMYHGQRKQHMNNVHSIKKSDKFLCDSCNRLFKRKNTLAEHMMDVHIEKKCQHCHLKFARKKYLFHMNEAHAIPMPTCGICGLRTLMESALIRHQRNVHLNEKRKECRICNKMFHSASNLKDHMITHNQNRVFKCDVCQKDFARKECYRAHYRLHTGERPFLCSICEASFVQRASLRSHLNSRQHKAKITAVKLG